jgi:hypothetical protein
VHAEVGIRELASSENLRMIEPYCMQHVYTYGSIYGTRTFFPSRALPELSLLGSNEITKFLRKVLLVSSTYYRRSNKIKRPKHTQPIAGETEGLKQTLRFRGGIESLQERCPITHSAGVLKWMEV